MANPCIEECFMLVFRLDGLLAAVRVKIVR